MLSENSGNGVEYRIYVSGFGPHPIYSEVVKYFSRFGPVAVDQRKMESMSARKREHRPSIDKAIVDSELSLHHQKGKNFVVLFCNDRRTYEAILYAKGLSHQGSQIVCSPFKTGIQLIMHNQKLNQRRAILRKVPTLVSKEELVQTLNVLVGSVDSVYVYPPRRNNTYGKHYSISITFHSKKSLEALMSQSEVGIYLLGERITVERYCSKKISQGWPITYSNKGTLTALPNTQNSLKKNHSKEKKPCLQASYFPSSLSRLQSDVDGGLKPGNSKYHLSSCLALSINHSQYNVRYNLINGNLVRPQHNRIYQ